jgi:hypothetical protein
VEGVQKRKRTDRKQNQGDCTNQSDQRGGALFGNPSLRPSRVHGCRCVNWPAAFTMASTSAAIATSKAARKNTGCTAMPRPITNAISKVTFAGSRIVSTIFFITPPLSVKAWFDGVFSDNRQLALTAQILRPVSHNDHAFPILLDRRSQRQRYAFRLRTSTCIRLNFS